LQELRGDSFVLGDRLLEAQGISRPSMGHAQADEHLLVGEGQAIHEQGLPGPDRTGLPVTGTADTYQALLRFTP